MEKYRNVVKVSVIVPVYNVENYLRKCLHSLVHQTLQNLEIVVVNDGSTDNSQAIIDEFALNFPLQIKSFTKPNGGLGDARNSGLDRANGEFIGFVDGDDYVSETMFEEMYGLGLKHNAELIICNLQKVDEQGNVKQKLTQIPNMPEKIDLKGNFSLFSDISYFACNKLFRKDLFDGKRFKKEMHFEDIELVPQLLLKCKTVAQTQNYLYQYVMRNNSISKTHTAKGLDILKAVQNVEVEFTQSTFANHRKELKNFQILEGVYTFLAYLAFVKDGNAYHKLSHELKKFIAEKKISTMDILRYKRFEKNYLLSLSLTKIIFYLLYFSGQEKLLRKLL